MGRLRCGTGVPQLPPLALTLPEQRHEDTEVRLVAPESEPLEGRLQREGSPEGPRKISGARILQPSGGSSWLCSGATPACAGHVPGLGRGLSPARPAVGVNPCTDSRAPCQKLWEGSFTEGSGTRRSSHPACYCSFGSSSQPGASTVSSAAHPVPLPSALTEPSSPRTS